MKIEILSGLPGSGKSTYVIDNGNNYVSADSFFMVDGLYKFDPSRLKEAHATCLKDFIHICQGGFSETLFVDNTNLSVEEIAPYYAIAEAYGHDPNIRLFETSLDVCLVRQTHGVPTITMHLLDAKFRKLLYELARIKRWVTIVNP